jgi:hypothetical protein
MKNDEVINIRKVVKKSKKPLLKNSENYLWNFKKKGTLQREFSP